MLLYGENYIPGTVDDYEADAVFSRYVGMLRVATRMQNVPGHAGLVDARTFLGLEMFPTVTKGRERKPCSPSPACFWLNDLDFFWQCVFLSLADGTGGVYCAVCGKELAPEQGRARKGRKPKSARPSRQRLCNTCRNREWKARQPRAVLQKKWREAKGYE
jgi:hypothetical protein